MSLSDLAVFQEYAQTSMTETQDQAVDKFNEQVRGGIILTSLAHEGDFSSTSIWAKISGLVRRRNAYGNGAQTPLTMSQLVNTSVKVAAGTPPVEIDPGMLKWIQKSPEEAGVVIGTQLAEDSMADMLNTGIMVYVANIATSDNVHDGTGAVASLESLNLGASKFGDRSQDIVCWLMHSKSAFDIYGQALANANQLFNFGNVNVITDGFGRPIILTDSPNLVTYVDPDYTYHQLGLAAGGIIVEQGNEFTDNIETSNGDENILRTYQAEWTYNLGVKGFSYTGTKSPDDATLASAANWDEIATSHKDLGGVLVNTQ